MPVLGMLLGGMLGGCPQTLLDAFTDLGGDRASAVTYERSCWDTNHDGVGQLEEDINGDGAFDELDCAALARTQGPAGPAGATGPAGVAGLSCWDLDGDGVTDPEEDVNDDGNWNALDCAGAQGLQGPTGAPGDSLVYGAGSAGPREFTASATLTDANLQYTDFTVATGVTLTIPSGAVIRCTGTFTNNGAIVMQTSARGGTEAATAPSTDAAYTPAHPGVSCSSAGSGEYGSSAATRAGGAGGVAISTYAARWILIPGANAGGGGGGAIGTVGGAGGGALVVLAEAGVVNYGTITANGAAGALRCGGGAGGIVILASGEAVVNTGTINASGGTGGNSDGSGGRGGGGGGGIVHLISPLIVPGTVNVLGGVAGASGGAVTADPRQGGGGGGACGGNGGAGGNVSAAGVVGTASAGSAGQSLQTNGDPRAWF